jgi:pimeloyl-ACP methyl ester carboxylesterase
MKMIALVLAAILVLAGIGIGIYFGTTIPLNATPGQKPVTPITKVPIRVIKTSDGSVSYRQTGYGPPLILIMGFAGSMDAWEPQFVDTLAKTHRVIIFDNAGIGETSMPVDPAYLTVSAMADQTHAFIKALGLSKTDVLGWSMGGMIAAALAAKYPQDIRRLVLAATLPGDGKAILPSPKVVQILQQSTQNISNLGSVLGLLFPPGHQNDENTFISQITEYPHFYTADGTIISAQSHALLAWVTGQEAAGKDLTHITAPTLIADGNIDPLIPLKNSYYLNKHIRGSKVIIYNDAEHGFLFQYESQFISAVNSFMGN